MEGRVAVTQHLGFRINLCGIFAHTIVRIRHGIFLPSNRDDLDHAAPSRCVLGGLGTRGPVLSQGRKQDFPRLVCDTFGAPKKVIDQGGRGPRQSSGLGHN